MISLFNESNLIGMVKKAPSYNPNKTCLAYTHCTPSAEKKKKTAWCKRFYVEDYGRRKKKVAGTGFEPPTLSLVDTDLSN